MIYTAGQFAAHLTARGATVSTSTDGPLTVVTARYDGVRTHAWFHADSGFRDAVIHHNAVSVEETSTLKRVVVALGLPVLAIAGRV